MTDLADEEAAEAESSEKVPSNRSLAESARQRSTNKYENIRSQTDDERSCRVTTTTCLRGSTSTKLTSRFKYDIVANRSA